MKGFIEWLIQIYEKYETIISILGVVISGALAIGSIIAAFKKKDEKFGYIYSFVALIFIVLTAVVIYWVSLVSGIIPDDTVRGIIRTEEPFPTSSTVVGDTGCFGTYEQDNIRFNKKENIEWLVLDIKDGKALLISKYILEQQPFNETLEKTDWNLCSLNEWLNNSFANTAFTDEQMERIQYYDQARAQIFLLSAAEADNYFRGNSEREAGLSIYSMRHLVEEHGDKAGYDNSEEAANENKNNVWWLRDSGNRESKAAKVNSNGKIDTDGWDVNNYAVGVRPAIWVEIQ